MTMQWQSRYLVLIAAIAAVALPVLFSGLPARSATAPDPEEAVSTVRLSAFMAPVQRLNGRSGMAPVTPLLDLAEGAKADEVCWLSPRIMDAFMTTLHRHPVVFRNSDSLRTGDLTKRLADAANRALGRELIDGVELVKGIKPSRNGGARFFKSAKCGQLGRK